MAWTTKASEFESLRSQKTFFCSKTPDQLWGPSKFLRNINRRRLPSGKEGGKTVMIHAHIWT